MEAQVVFSINLTKEDICTEDWGATRGFPLPSSASRSIDPAGSVSGEHAFRERNRTGEQLALLLDRFLQVFSRHLSEAKGPEYIDLWLCKLLL